MTREEFIKTLDVPGASRVGATVRSRVVVHSLGGNASFKAYFAGDFWIAETWDPAAFLFRFGDSNVVGVAGVLLSQSLHSQFDFVQRTFPSAVRLSSCSLLDIPADSAEPQMTAELQNAAKYHSSISFRDFDGGFHLQADGLVVVLLHLGDPTALLCKEDCLLYCSDDAFEHPAISDLFATSGLTIAMDGY